MRNRRTFLRIGFAVGVLLACAPLFGLLGTMAGMARAFRTLGDSGIGDPRSLAGAIGEMLFVSAGSLALFPAGLVLLIVCGRLLRQSRQPGSPPLPRFPENLAGPPD